jgi:K+-sensing histidine kinase KdpD
MPQDIPAVGDLFVSLRGLSFLFVPTEKTTIINTIIKRGALMPQTTFVGRCFHKAAVVVAAVALATLFTFPLAPRMFHSRDLLFVAAVILVTRYEGSVAGICTALLCVLAFDWYFDQTPGVFDLTIGNGFRIAVFISLSAMVAVLDRQRRRAMDTLVTANQNLKTALDEIRTLRGTLLICSYCKKIETNPETWMEVENYVRKHSEAEFNHGVCPDCLRKEMRRLM